MTTASSLHNDLINALTLRSQPDGSWRAPYFSDGRGVVFGGQLLGQGIVAASHQMPDKRVHTVQTLFARGVRADEPADIRVVTMHEGRNIGSVTVSFVQDGRTCARMLVLLDAEEPDLVFYQIEMPDVDAPDPAVAQAHPLTAPETIIVGDVDVRDPALTGPANLQLWGRFPDAPADDPGLHRALVAHTTDGWSIATAMRPHPNLGQAMAHKTVSTAVLTQTLLKKKSGGRIAAVEIMVGTTAVRNLIREGKLHQIPGMMQASQKDGMQTMDMALVDLATRGMVTKAEAQSRSMNANLFNAAGAA